MRSIVVVSLFAFSAVGFAFGATPVRKATVSCNFSKMFDSEGKLEIEKERGKLDYVIDLDSKKVLVKCGSRNPEECLLDGDSVDQTLKTKASKEASFAIIREAVGTHGGYATSTNLPALDIDGGNGDDMDMFTRMTFSIGFEPGKITATAVLIYADEGNDGSVSVPTNCKVKLGR